MSAMLDTFPAFVQDLFVSVPDSVNSALETPFCQRKRLLSPSSFVRTLVFGWLDDPDASVVDLADYAATLDCPVSESGLRKRFTAEGVALLNGVLDYALQPLIFGQHSPSELLHRFNGVHVFDTSYIPLPACLAKSCPGCGNQTGKTNASGKILFDLEITSGGLVQLDLFAAREPDQKLIHCCQPLPEGALMLRDLSFFSLEDLNFQDKQKVFYLSRAHPQLVVQRAKDQSQTLMQFLRGKGPLVDVQVEVGTKHRLKCRLIAWRVPDWVAQRRKKKRLEQHNRKQRRRQRKQRRGQPVSQGKGSGRGQPKRSTGPTAEQLEQCEWVVVLTNVPPEKLSPKEAEALLRARWQIELLIKVWKQSGRLETIKANKPQRALCELLAKLLGQLVAHWAVLSSGQVYLEVNVMGATKKVKKYAERLGQALGRGLQAFEQLWGELRLQLQRQGKRRQGRKRPSTAQRLDGQEPPWFSLGAD
jgi:hypothetical protein